LQNNLISDLKFVNQTPIKQRVLEGLRDKIAKLNHGQKLPSERELSKKFEVDRGTVRRALVDLAREGFVLRQRGRGTFVSKQNVHNVAKSINTDKIGFILPNTALSLELSVFAGMLEGIEAEAEKNGYRIITCFQKTSPDRERELLEELVDEGINNILMIVSLKNSMNAEFIKRINELNGKGVNIVTVDRYLPETKVPSATLGKVKLGYLSTEHLVVLGHTKICFVSEHTFSPSGDEAFIGYKRALQDHGVEFDPSLVIDISAMNCAIPTKNAIIELFTKTPNACTAIATSQFSMTYGIYRALKKLGKKIPEDVALVGVDVYTNPEIEYLTHILQPANKLGAEAVKLLLKTGEYQEDSLKNHVVLEPELVIGKTCGYQKASY